MSGVQSWAISVCFTVIAASILQYISPNGAMERVMKLVLGAFVLYGIMMPIISLVPQISNGFDAYIDVEQPNPSVDLTDTVNSQIHTAASSGIQNIVTVELAKKGVNCENVELIMDTNEDNSISISKVLVTVSGATMSQDVGTTIKRCSGITNGGNNPWRIKKVLGKRKKVSILCKDCCKMTMREKSL